jgi:hypothetical protein
MRLEEIAIAGIIFGLFISLGFLLYSEQITNYGLPTDGIVMGRNYLNDSKTLTDNTNEIIEGSEVSTDNSDSAVAKAAIPGAKDITEYKNDMGKNIEYITQVFNLPTEIKVALIMILGVLTTAFIIYMFRGFKPQKD